jgi:ABC-type polysaccharide/polyol phosphate transport system ATPase subunit
MSSEAGYAVSAQGVGKKYELGELASLPRTAHNLMRVLARRPPRLRMFKALDDVTFSVHPGEAFGILGSNGSGKSTLLSIIAEITLPSSGEVRVRGRVVPLFSVAAGFHLELTGRENVVMFGTVLGIPRGEVLTALPQIADFAEIDSEHMGTPVKRFSEGMMSRLAFATALSFPADVYIFDEVLVTADDHFKAKCTDAIVGLRDRGAAVFFISHELALVRAICSRGMWLEDGRMREIGPIDEIADAYETAGLQPT